VGCALDGVAAVTAGVGSAAEVLNDALKVTKAAKLADEATDISKAFGNDAKTASWDGSVAKWGYIFEEGGIPALRGIGLGGGGLGAFASGIGLAESLHSDICES